MALGESSIVEGDGAVLGQPLRTPAAWTAADALAHPEQWQHVLTEEEAEELIRAARSAVASGKPVTVRRRQLQLRWRLLRWRASRHQLAQSALSHGLCAEPPRPPLPPRARRRAAAGAHARRLPPAPAGPPAGDGARLRDLRPRFLPAAWLSRGPPHPPGVCDRLVWRGPPLGHAAQPEPQGPRGESPAAPRPPCAGRPRAAAPHAPWRKPPHRARRAAWVKRRWAT